MLETFFGVAAFLAATFFVDAVGFLAVDFLDAADLVEVFDLAAAAFTTGFFVEERDLAVADFAEPPLVELDLVLLAALLVVVRETVVAFTRIACPATTFSPRIPFRLLRRATLTP
ncbi:MAG: hypothetical protein ABI852_11300 [Gemmatimonadaceae bacterium]